MESDATVQPGANATPPTLLCIACGYDLRAADPKGNCPECGLPVDHSLHGNWLRYADPIWADELLRNLNRVYSSACCILLVWLAWVGLSLGVLALAAFTNLDSNPSTASDILWSIVCIITLIASALVLVVSCVRMTWGVWGLTLPRPHTPGPVPLRSRALRPVTALVLPFFGSCLVANLTGSWIVTWPRPAITAISIFGCILLGTHVWLVLNHLGSIERQCEGFDTVRARSLDRHQGFAILWVVAAVVYVLLIAKVSGPQLIGAGTLFIWMAFLTLTGTTRNALRTELAKRPTTPQNEPRP